MGWERRRGARPRAGCHRNPARRSPSCGTAWTAANNRGREYRAVRSGAGGFGVSGGVGGRARFLFRGPVRLLPVVLFSLLPARARVRTGLRLGGRAGRERRLRVVVAVRLGQAVGGFPDAEMVPGLRVGRKREAGMPRQMMVETRWARWGGVGGRTRPGRPVVEWSDGGCVVSRLGVRDVGRRLFGWENAGQVIAAPLGRHRRSRPSQVGLCQGGYPGRKPIPRRGRRRRGRRRVAGPKFRLGRDRGAVRCGFAR